MTMIRAVRPPTVPATDFKPGANVRWPAGRFLKQHGGEVDPSSVDSGFRDRVRSRAASERGFTLIEVLVAALITLIISAGVATALISATDYTSLARGQTNAQAVAEQDQERLKSMTDAQLTSLHQTRTVTNGNSQWTVTSTATFLNASGGSSCTTTGTAFFKLNSTVTQGAVTLASVGTIITRPLAGSLVVPVQDQTAAPLSGVGITVVGQQTNYTASATTDVNGCVAFAGLPTDSYTITARDPGFVDPNGNASPSETATVNQTKVVAANTIIMGAAANIRVGFRTVGSSGAVYDGLGSDPAPPVGYETSYYGNGGGIHMTNPGCVLASGTCTATGTPPAYSASVSTSGQTMTAGSLFPFESSGPYTSNYQVWAGACPQEQPLQPPAGTGWATNFGSVTPGEALPAGTATDVTVDEPALDIAVKAGSTVYPPSDVTLTFTGYDSSGTTVNCTDAWHLVPQLGTEPVSGTTYGIYAAPFASTATAGSATASADGLTGKLTVCADYKVNSTTWDVGTASNVTDTNFTGGTVVPTITGVRGTKCS
jgi:prepilin-type N-terminal cleavage/methylation domain-containing protein